MPQVTSLPLSASRSHRTCTDRYAELLVCAFEDVPMGMPRCIGTRPRNYRLGLSVTKQQAHLCRFSQHLLPDPIHPRVHRGRADWERCIGSAEGVRLETGRPHDDLVYSNHVDFGGNGHLQDGRGSSRTPQLNRVG